ncbi:ribonuclease Z [uncultured Algibacter sp.]|uniref:ribonuclease Z n=1 Tax=uncultured Algibacter sp. TaxID=298659 RepID=UPI0032167A62
MIIDQNANTSIITQEKATIITLVSKLQEAYSKFKNNNIIIVLTQLNPLGVNDINEFLQISNTHREAKHSFVVVSSKIDLDIVPDDIIVVPTIQEAYDVIEMEDIERDLGF